MLGCVYQYVTVCDVHLFSFVSFSFLFCTFSCSKLSVPVKHSVIHGLIVKQNENY